MTTTKTFMAARSQANRFGKALPVEYNELAKKLDEEARDNWDNPAWHRAVAQDLSSYLDYGFTFDNEFSSWFLTENVGEFDRVILNERRGLKVYYTARGGYINESQLQTENWEVPRDTLGFHISEMEDKLRAGFAKTIADIATLGRARLEAEVNRRIFTLLQSAVPSNSDYYDSGAGITKEMLDAAIVGVKEEIKPDGISDVPVTIIGRASVIDQISEFDGFAPEAVPEEIRRVGHLGRYRGCQIRQLMNHADEDGESYFPANEMWVFAGTVGKFVTYGPLLTKSWNENTVDYVHYRARKDVGGLVNHPEQSRRLIDSSLV